MGTHISAHVEPCIPRVAGAVKEPGMVTGDWDKLESIPFCSCGTLQMGEEALQGRSQCIVDLPASGRWLPFQGVQTLRGHPSWLAAGTIPSGNGRLPEQRTKTQVHGGSRAIYRIWIGFSFLPAVRNATAVVGYFGERRCCFGCKTNGVCRFWRCDVPNRDLERCVLKLRERLSNQEGYW